MRVELFTEPPADKGRVEQCHPSDSVGGLGGVGSFNES